MRISRIALLGLIACSLTLLPTAVGSAVRTENTVDWWKRIDIYSIHYRIETVVDIRPEQLIRQRDAIHVVIDDPAALARLQFQIEAAPQFPPEYQMRGLDARIVGIITKDIGPPDTLSMGDAYMRINDQKLKLADSLILRGISKFLPHDHQEEIDEYIENVP